MPEPDVRILDIYCTINVRNPNVRLVESINRTSAIWTKWFGFQTLSEIQAFWEWYNFGKRRNPNVWISDIYWHPYSKCLKTRLVWILTPLKPNPHMYVWKLDKKLDRLKKLKFFLKFGLFVRFLIKSSFQTPRFWTFTAQWVSENWTSPYFGHFGLTWFPDIPMVSIV